MQTPEETKTADAAQPAVSKEEADALSGLAGYLRSPRRLIGLNFVVGVARGFGMAVGFTLLGALVIYVVKQLEVLNIPLIGDFIAQILEYVELARGMRV